MDPDRELMERMKADDTGALEQLILRWQERAEAYAVSILHDPHLAEDAVMEGTLRVFDDGVRASVLEYFHRVIQDVAHAHGCTAEIEIKEVTGIVVNDASLVALANEPSLASTLAAMSIKTTRLTALARRATA